MKNEFGDEEVPSGNTRVNEFGDAEISPYVAGPSVFDAAKEKAQRAASNFYTPLLIAGSSAVGSIAAMPADVATFNPVPSVVGGALMGAAGKKVAKMLDIATGYREPDDLRTEMLETAADIAIGVPEEIVGMTIPIMVASPFLVDGLPRFKFKILPKQKAEALLSEKLSGSLEGEGLVAPTSWGPIYAKNIQEAKEIEDAIGVRFSLGQRTNSPSAIMLERGAARKATGGADLYKEMEAFNNNKIHEYFNTHFGGDENIDHLLRAATDYKAGRVADISVAQKAAEDRLLKIADENPDAFGPVLDNIRANNAAYKAKAGELFDNVPKDLEVPIDPIKGSIEKMLAEFDPQLEKSTTFPSKLVGGIQQKLSPKAGQIEIPDEGLSFAQLKELQAIAKDGRSTMTFDELRKLRSTITDELRNPGISPKLTKRYADLLDGVEASLNKLEDADVAPYREANQFYKGYKQKFDHGVVGDILRKGPRGEPTRFSDMQVAQKFFRSNRAEDIDQLFSTAIDPKTGRVDPRAKQRIVQSAKEYAVYDFNKAARGVDGEINTNKAKNWFKKNERILKKYGIDEDFKNINKMQDVVDVSQAKFKEFERSSAAKLLDADPDVAVRRAFMSEGLTTRNAMRGLLKVVEKDPAAKKGLENSFANFMFNEAKKTTTDITGKPRVVYNAITNLIKKYEPAMRELYGEKGSKYMAMKRLQKAVEIQNRNAASPIGGGSDTAENLGTSTVMQRLIGSSYGLKSLPITVSKAFQGIGERRAADYTLQALFNPDDSELLMRVMKRTIDLEKANTIIKQRIMGQVLGGIMQTTGGGDIRAVGGAMDLAVPDNKPNQGFEDRNILNYR